MASAPNHMMDAAWAPRISSLPFFSFSLILFSPSLLHYLKLYMSLFGNRGGLEHSLTQLPYHCMAASSVFPSWHWHYIHTDIILGIGFPFLSLSFAFSRLSSLFSFPCCCLHWHSLLLYPPELSIRHDCKANAWDFLKQTASVLCCSPICG